MSTYKYLADGHAAEIVKQFDDGSAIIREEFEYDVDDGYGNYKHTDVAFGRPYWVAKDDLYDKAPTRKLDKTIVDLRGTIQSLNKERNDLRNDVRNIKIEYSEYEYALKSVSNKHKSLKLIEQYFNNAFTHIVTWSYSDIPSIVGIDDRESRCGNEACERNLKLISFSGEVPYRKPDDAKWELNQYKDGSGSSSKGCIPCISIEHANEVMKTRLAALVADKDKWHLRTLHELCILHDVPVSGEFETYVKDKQIDELSKKRVKLIDKMSNLESQLNTINDEIGGKT